VKRGKKKGYSQKTGICKSVKKKGNIESKTTTERRYFPLTEKERNWKPRNPGREEKKAVKKLRKSQFPRKT